LRIGVGRPSAESHQSVADYVLENFSKADMDALNDVYGQIMSGVDHFLRV
jgi:peptidyl-tRNA hydrolase